nr:unnamed protein product [Digitaria exilis]
MAPSFLSCSYSSHSPFMHARMRMLLASKLRRHSEQRDTSPPLWRYDEQRPSPTGYGQAEHHAILKKPTINYSATRRGRGRSRRSEHHPVAVCMHRVTIDPSTWRWSTYLLINNLW